ncbi:MAG: 4-hydroxy-tetrahydrodipicolinate reductase [Candidatus Falkowbacteria bacterium]
MINVAICGVRGKMGDTLYKLCLKTSGINIVGAFERIDHPDVGILLDHILQVNGLFQKRIAEIGADVILDFTEPSASVKHASIAATHGKAIVIGTTNFSENQKIYIKACAESIPIVLAPNFSVGVNILFKVLADVAKITADDYDVEIMEAHHNQKKDAPSGTAIKMGEIIATTLERSFAMSAAYARKGLGERAKDEIGIQSIRGGDIFGEHTIMFCGRGERLEFIHRASSRDNFARGAIRAAKWVVDKPVGLYDMQDVLGLR